MALVNLKQKLNRNQKKKLSVHCCWINFVNVTVSDFLLYNIFLFSFLFYFQPTTTTMSSNFFAAQICDVWTFKKVRERVGKSIWIQGQCLKVKNWTDWNMSLLFPDPASENVFEVGVLSQSLLRLFILIPWFCKTPQNTCRKHKVLSLIWPRLGGLDYVTEQDTQS